MAVGIIGRQAELLAFDAFLEPVPAGGQALLLDVRSRTGLARNLGTGTPA
jgi:hypothetical protein